MSTSPDYRHFEEALKNRRPERLPLYEHNIDIPFIEKATGRKFPALAKEPDAFMQLLCDFFKENGYDVVSYEIGIPPNAIPEPHALTGGQGQIQSMEDIEKFDWTGAVDRYWRVAEPAFRALARAIPDGMKAVGGVGYGVFELAEDLVGLEYLPYLEADDPEAHAVLYRRIGDLMETIWRRFLTDHGECYLACRFGDDLGFRSSLLTTPAVVRECIMPQYKRLIDLIHSFEKPFIWHSCGCIFEIMDEMIALGIDAKHSNEDAIAPFERWIRDYNDRIALLGGIDMDFLCRGTPDEVYTVTKERGRLYRSLAKGYALGTGNSVPDYVPVENYTAMIKAGRELQTEK